MRAMPSPTCRTLPTSSMSTAAWYCSICSRRTLVISSGRSFMAPAFPFSFRWSGWGLDGGRGEAALELGELVADGGVDQEAAGPEHQARDDRRVDALREGHLVVRLGGHALHHSLTQIGGQRDRGDRLDLEAALGPGDALGEGGGDVVEDVLPPPVEQDLQEVLQ